MDYEFHYYITGLVAYSGGFSKEEAEVIAYASQYVDDNEFSLTVSDNTTGEKYRTIITQTVDIALPLRDLDAIYPVFHFVPGDGGCAGLRCDGRTNPLCVTADSSRSRAIMQAAFLSAPAARLYRIGIASHTFADTFSHQGFTGTTDRFNRLNGFWPLPVGHSNAGLQPDWCGNLWQDTRLIKRVIDNSERFIQAAKRLYQCYRCYLAGQGRGSNSSLDVLEGSIRDIESCAAIGDFGKEFRLWHYREMMPWLPEYDRWNWFNDAVEPEATGFGKYPYKVFPWAFRFNWKVERGKTHWFMFQEAAKEHQRFVLLMIQPLLQR
ncbi:MAG: hypothetical protein HQL09_05825 [Nitrospirae bacterium]|nr:hypothetical protein [Nitrospirota bacterium]